MACLVGFGGPLVIQAALLGGFALFFWVFDCAAVRRQVYFGLRIIFRGGEVAALAASTPGPASALAGTGGVPLLGQRVPF